MPRWVVARVRSEVEHVVVDAKDEDQARRHAADGQIVEVLEDHPGNGFIVPLDLSDWDVSPED